MWNMMNRVIYVPSTCFKKAWSFKSFLRRISHHLTILIVLVAQLCPTLWPHRASLVAQMVKRPPAMRETRVRFLGREDPLEKEMAIHSSILAWKIPWMEEPDRLQSMGSQRVRHDWATSLSLFTLTFTSHSWANVYVCVWTLEIHSLSKFQV